MKEIGVMLDSLLAEARRTPAIRAQLLQTREEDEPMLAFCNIASAFGYPITPGELIAAGEEYSCNQLKSTNGGGVNPYDFYDDLYDNFFISPKRILSLIKKESFFTHNRRQKRPISLPGVFAARSMKKKSKYIEKTAYFIWTLSVFLQRRLCILRRQPKPALQE